MTDVMHSLAYQHGKPLATGRLKAQPEHFFVSETLDFTPAGHGEHFLVRIRKIGENTKYVANELAKACGVKSRDVSWAGLKDRHAVTEQWFSVHLPGQDDPDLTEFVDTHEGVDAILETTRHDKKLRPGDLIGNRFSLVITDFTGDAAIDARLSNIRDKGVPNYFGSQRFGRNGNNVVSAREWGQDKFRVRDKSKRSFYLSAARSYMFNQVLSARIEQGMTHTPMRGDMLIDNTEHLKLVLDTDKATELLEKGHWLISGPMTGDNALPTEADARKFEQNIIDQEPDLLAVIRSNRMRHDRRALMLFPQEMEWTCEKDTLTVSFSLPAGSFATAVMREVIEESMDEEFDAHSDQ
ncbi:tRNA pseudouridine(13) synthase TruD [Enterovibrio norvegicus]|uniref:tRNA pseudouridine(13) synthase TruD n=1 Tax=Enterovibrio norvegicus TaxID=188144 RepID=UPI000C8653A7|nr:tRNA pseudouridine(13) synthase TruD [Enterovibrio norvegicus]MCC4800691.1 tRNA pseudouridine(13) synthase TruD [Enterovibrio norvegicus]PMI29497.1 tRNA pseudouridine(13) synthase TruD [Enterovibrio norvegicus]PMI36612.1 tRNA pseudouridine(13) synthase TruD [Enterovibrio norvegicus]PMN46031.1 tRNA pseudouridine(13) synthase TruD [Enterovibrio norvegicus]TKF16339.1 tRNA pseudouridine(13) synthase TruD [Enterovibrio norvegicus]